MFLGKYGGERRGMRRRKTQREMYFPLDLWSK